MTKLQKVKEALESLQKDRFGSVEAVDEVINEALTELNEFMEGDIKAERQTLWDAWATAYPVVESSDISDAKNDIMIFISDYLEQQST